MSELLFLIPESSGLVKGCGFTEVWVSIPRLLYFLRMPQFSTMELGELYLRSSYCKLPASLSKADTDGSHTPNHCLTSDFTRNKH